MAGGDCRALDSARDGRALAHEIGHYLLGLVGTRREA
jgi:hypothetical protein